MYLFPLPFLIKNLLKKKKKRIGGINFNGLVPFLRITIMKNSVIQKGSRKLTRKNKFLEDSP